MPRTPARLALVLAFATSACGGGCGSGEAAVTPATVEPPPSAEPQPPSQPRGGAPARPALACAPTAGSPDAPPPLPARDQASVVAIRDWDGGVAVEVAGVGWYRLDPASGVLSPLEVEGLERVTSIARWGDRAVALGWVGAGAALRVRGGDPASLPVPEGFEGARLVADDRGLALVTASDVAIRRDGGDWRPLRGVIPASGAGALALQGDRLYLGYARGEFGGGLVVVDLASSRASGAPSGDQLPVTEIARAPSGDVYVLEGLAHLGLRRGRLRRFSPTGEESVVSSCDGLTDEERARMREHCGPGCFGTRRWPLAPSSFEGLALDAQGRPVVLSRGQGALRFDAEGESHLTPNWRYDTYWTSLSLHGDIAIAGTYDAGLVVWDREGSRVQTVCVPRRGDVAPTPTPAGGG